MGVGNHSRALIAKAWSLSKVRARLANKTSEPVNLERGLPQGAPESPNHLRHDSGMCGQTLRGKVGSERLGFLSRRNEMGECKLRRRHFLHQRKEARSGGYDKRHHIRVGGCWSGAGSKQNTQVNLSRKAWRGTARWLRTDTVGASVGFRVHGVGLEWIIVGSSQKQVESGSSVN